MVVCDLSVVEANFGIWIHRRSGTEPVEQAVQAVQAVLDSSSKANALSRSAAAEVGDVCKLCSAIHRISGPAAPIFSCQLTCGDRCTAESAYSSDMTSSTIPFCERQHRSRSLWTEGSGSALGCELLDLRPTEEHRHPVLPAGTVQQGS